MSEDKLFEEYLDDEHGEPGGFFKQPKGWLIIFTVVLGVVLTVLFINSAIIQTMSAGEIEESVDVVWHKAQWVDKKATPQEIKIVPSVRLKVRNSGKRPLQYLDIQAVFIFEETGSPVGDRMVRLFKEPLPPGETSPEILISSRFGYSAKSKAKFMENKKDWKKVQAKLFARAKGSPLVRIGEIIPIPQEIEGFETGSTGGDEKPSEYLDKNTIELAHSIRVVNQDSLWVDKAASRGEVIIVPSITFEIKNMGQQPLHRLYFKGVFKYEDTGEILSEGLAPGLSKELAPGETGEEITIKADFGYTATSKEAFIHNNKKWKRLKVGLYAKNKESEYALLGTYPIKQKIQGIKVVYH
ncbi:MAG: hypothetical protein GY940_14855 [bacterium]|nr:hypothetical protein [bacterium]